MSRPRLIALLLALVLALAACGGGDDVDVGGGDDGGEDTSSDGGDGGTLVAAIGGEPDQLDPHLTTAYPSFQVLENVYDTLVQPDAEGEMVAALASDWEVSDDDLTWTFDLRDGVTWHNGRELVAEDVVFSYERIMDEEVGAANAYRFDAVESVEAPDDDTVVINVSRPTPNLLTLIGSFKGMAIVPPEIVEDGTIGQEPVGTGPFMFDEYVAGDHLTLVRNPDYWQEGKPHLDEVRFQFIPEETVKLTNLESGDVDWVDGLPPQRVEELSGRDNIVVESTPSLDYWYLATNIAREPFSERAVRRAISFAIDREVIAEAARFDAATPNQTAIPESNPWYFEYSPYEHDPEQARQLLEEAGVGDGFGMELMVTDEFPETVTAAQVIESQLGEVGIDVQIRTLDFATWLDEQGQGNFDAFMLGWLGNFDPEGFYYAQHHSEGGFNFHGYSNPDVDELLEQGRVETDEEARKDIYDQAAKLIVDDASYIYLYNPDNVGAWLPSVSGYEVRGDKAIRFEDTRIDE